MNVEEVLERADVEIEDDGCCKTFTSRNEKVPLTEEEKQTFVKYVEESGI